MSFPRAHKNCSACRRLLKLDRYDEGAAVCRSCARTRAAIAALKISGQTGDSEASAVPDPPG